MSEMMIIEPRRQLADVTRDIRIKTGQFLLDAIEIGRLLHEAKTMVEPGGWMDYVKRELPFSQSWVNNYMRLYKEYGAEQLSIFGNSQATAKLSPTQALELLALPPQEREEFMETHDVENMSTRDLKQAIQERDEALQAQQEAEQAQSEAEEQLTRGREKISQLQEDLTNAKAAGEAAAAEVEKLKTQLAKAKEKRKAAEDALAKAKENPEIPESLMAEMRQQVAADAAKEATEDLQKKLEAATAAKESADKARAAAEQKLEAAEKAAKLANPETAVLQVLSKRFLDEFNNMHNQLKQVMQTDPKTGEKLKGAIINTIDQMRGMIAGN